MKECPDSGEMMAVAILGSADTGTQMSRKA